jgi:transposase
MTSRPGMRFTSRLIAGREESTAAIIDSRTLRSTPESGTRAGYDGAKRKRGSKVHMAVDTLGHLLALHVTPADVGDRQAVARLAADIQDATGETVTLAYVDQGYTGQAAAEAAATEGIKLEVIKLPKQNEASFCCQGAGLWSGPLHGLRAAGVLSKTTSDTPKHSQPSTSSLSSATCLNTQLR